MPMKRAKHFELSGWKSPCSPKPAPRTLTIQELPDEVLIFDHQCHKAHCLNRAARLIWKHCDGRTSLAELADRVRHELGSEHPEAVVELALEQLAHRRLLQNAVERPTPERRRSRRDLLKKMAVAALALPAVMTVAAPQASAAASLACTSNAQCSALTANGGCVVGVCQSGRCTTTTAANGTACTTSTGVPGVCLAGACGIPT